MPGKGQLQKGKTVSIATRREEVARLYMQGMSYREIAKYLSERDVNPYNVSHVTIKKDVDTILEELHKDTIEMTDKYRAREDARLHNLLKFFNSILRDPNVDRDQRITAADKALRVSEQIRKLWGLDMPAKVDVTSGGDKIKAYVGLSPDMWDMKADPDEGESE